MNPLQRTAPGAAAAELLRAGVGGAGSAEDRALVEEMLSLAGTAGFAQGAAALAPQEAVSLAVLGDHDTVALAEGGFAAWFPETQARTDLRGLAARARRDGSALGLLQTADGAAVAAWAVCGPPAAKWARTEAIAAALAPRGRVLVLVFAPSRSGELAARAVAAFGLTPLESRLAEAFLFASTLEIAGAQVGVGRETARDAMARIMAKTGARRATDVVRRLVELMGGGESPPPAQALLGDAFGLTPAEAGVAIRLAAGATAREAADDLGLKLGTVQTYSKSVLAKTGVARAKDLARLVAETQALSRLTAVAEPVFTSGSSPARLRLLPRPNGRQMAFLDYGPASGRAVFVFHGFMAGRSVPPALARALQIRGLRPLVQQRPGFGLTSPADGDYLACTTDDRLALMAAMGLDEVILFARDGGTAAALAFAAAHPRMVTRGVLMNPRSPLGVPRHDTGPVSRMARAILRHPQAIAGLGELIRRRTRSDFLEAGLRQTLGDHPGDRAALEDPAVRAQLVRDMQAQFAHSAAGYVAEHRLYAKGWSVPRVEGGGRWTVVSLGVFGDLDRRPWEGLPGVTFEHLGDAGVLAQFTHAERLAAIIAGASGEPPSG